MTLAMPVGERALLVFAALVLVACASKPEVERPNLLLIVADDLGIEGLRTYGGEYYETPNIDALAARGVRFENVYATPLCVPSRVELLTGQYPFRTGAHAAASEGAATSALSPSLPSFARSLRDAGYATAVAGKWHLGPLQKVPDHPQQLGFETYSLWEQRNAQDRYWAPRIVQDGVLREDLIRDDVYGPDVSTDFLVEFIEKNRDRPWFALYSMVLAHRPYTATPATVKSGTESKKARGERGDLVDNRENVAYLDRLVGRLLEKLQELGLEDRTIVLFTGDNGTDAFTEMIRDGKVVRGGKSKLDEGGATVPLIVAGPGVVGGAVRPGLVDLTDFFPTLLELARVPLPEGVVLDGKSFASDLRGESADRRSWAYVQLGPRWFVTDARHRLHHDGSFFDVAERFARPPLGLREPLSPDVAAARGRLEATVRELRPELAPLPAAPAPTATRHR